MKFRRGRRSAQEAWDKWPYVEAHPPHAYAGLFFDIDDSDRWDFDVEGPCPNWQVRRDDSRRPTYHIACTLATPVARHDAARLAPLSSAGVRCSSWGSRGGGGGEATRRREKCDPLYAGQRRWNSGHHAGPRRSRLSLANTRYFRRYGNRMEMLTSLCSGLDCGSRACRPKCWNEVAAVEDARVTRRTPTGSTRCSDNARHGVALDPV